MKKLLLITLLSLSSTAALATTLVSTEVFNDGRAQNYCGFSEDGFSSPTSVCFIGDAREVCPIISKQQGQIEEQFRDGGHGRFEVLTCGLSSDNSVALSYIKNNDYDGSETRILNIKACAARVTCGF